MRLKHPITFAVHCSAVIGIMCCLGFEAVAQGGTGTITGRVFSLSDDEISGAPIEAKNLQTGRVSKTISSPSGDYTFAQLPIGTYEISSPIAGFERKEAEVRGGESTPIDIHYKEAGRQLGTIGDSPLYRQLAGYNRPAPPTGEAPRTADGTPDFSGYWNLVTTDAEKPEMLAWAEALAKYRLDHETEALPPGSRCLPEDILRVSQVIQTRKYLVVLMQFNSQSHRLVFLDGREHPKELDPTWFGHAIGKWDGETLIVDRVGFNEGSWLGGGAQGLPHTDRLHVIERYRRPDFGHLEVETIIEDVASYVKPWTRKTTYELQPHEEVQEYVCENNLDPVNILAK